MTSTYILFRVLGTLTLVASGVTGFMGYFAYSFWSAGANPTSDKNFKMCGIFFIASLVLFALGSRPDSEKSGSKRDRSKFIDDP